MKFATSYQVNRIKGVWHYTCPINAFQKSNTDTQMTLAVKGLMMMMMMNIDVAFVILVLDFRKT